MARLLRRYDAGLGGLLPYFKLHFYKTDQYIYNYPYTVGYLL